MYNILTFHVYFIYITFAQLNPKCIFSFTLNYTEWNSQQVYLTNGGCMHHMAMLNNDKIYVIIIDYQYFNDNNTKTKFEL